MYVVVNKILLLWSFLPLFAIVNNARFMRSEYSSNGDTYSIDLENMELCIINLRFGLKALQIVCIGRNGIKASEYVDAKKISVVNDEDYEKRETEYREHLSTLSARDQNIEESALEMQQKRYERSIKIIEEKLKSLHGILVAMLFPVILFLLNNKLLQSAYYEKIFIFINTYLMLNIFLLLLDFYSCQTINIQTFRGLKESIQKDKEFVLQKYMNWQYETGRQKLYAIYNHIYTDTVDVIVIVNIICLLYLMIIADTVNLLSVSK